MGCRNNVAGTGNQNRCACVFECLLELLEDAMEKDDVCCGWVGSGGGSNCRPGCGSQTGPGGGSHCRPGCGSQTGPGGGSQIRCDCDCVFECLIELLEAATEDPCRCPR